MSYASSPNDSHDVYQYAYMMPQNNYGHTYISDSGILQNEDSNFWPSSPRTDSSSPNGMNPIVGPYQIYTPISYEQNDHRAQYTTEYEYNPNRNIPGHPPFVRIVKRRTTANKKERRRTQSINNAYADLRDCIPNIKADTKLSKKERRRTQSINNAYADLRDRIPNIKADTKLSKIKTLRLATSYISYLTGVLETDEPAGGFKAEITSSGRKSSNNHVQVNECTTGQISPKNEMSEELSNSRRAKGRTGWPQHVWCLELKQEQTL